MEDIEKFGIENWRKYTEDNGKRRALINRSVQANPLYHNIKDILHKRKERVNNRRSAESIGGKPQKVTYTLVKNANKMYIFPRCNQQEIANHVSASDISLP